MARFGDTIRPELGRTDYSGFLQGAQQGAAYLGQGIEKLGQGAGDFLKQQKERKKQLDGAAHMMESMAALYQESPIGQLAAQQAAFFKNEEVPLSQRMAGAEQASAMLNMFLHKSETDFTRSLQTEQLGLAKRGADLDERRFGLEEWQTEFGMGETVADRKLRERSLVPNEINAQINQDEQAAEQARRVGAASAQQFLLEAQSGKSTSSIGALFEAFAPSDPSAVEEYKGQVAAGLNAMQAANQTPLTVTEQIAIEKHNQEKAESQAVASAGAESANQFITGLENLRDHKGFNGLFGMGLGNSLIPGTAATDAKVLLSQLDAKGFMVAIKEMKGMGALSDAEGQKASIAFTGLKPSMSEKAAKKQIEEVIGILKKGQARAKEISGGGSDSGQPQMTVEELKAYLRGEGAAFDPAPGGAGAEKKSDSPDLSAVLPEPLRGHAAAFANAGREYGVDPLALAAISRLETANGTSSAFRNKRNAMGVSNSSGPIAFKSVDDSIYRMARVLANPNGPYSGASTIAEIGAIYAPPGAGNDPNGTNGYWPSGVSKYLAQMGGDPSASIFR